MKLTVLGGGTPFVLPLFVALARAGAAVAGLEVVLHGRDRTNLERVSRCAAAVSSSVDVRVTSTVDRAAALSGAHIVLVQVRPGGMEGRDADERFAAQLGCTIDETLGPAALRRALASRSILREVGRALVAHAADATVLVLTNPLAPTIVQLAECGVRRMLGVCELPTTTVRAAAVPFTGDDPCVFGAVEWDWVGFNHRGFATRIEFEGRDLLARIAEDDHDVRELGALPTKYHALLVGPSAWQRPGRARELAALRERALDELLAAPLRVPPAIGERTTDWYDEAVVPMVRALLHDTGAVLPVDVLGSDGLVRELRASITRAAVVHRTTTSEPTTAVRRWLACFEAHERALGELVRRPSTEALERVVALDPTIPAEQRAGVAAALAPFVHSAADDSMTEAVS